MNPAPKKHPFQIRKVPLRSFLPDKTPELYALDVHSIFLPSKMKNKSKWTSLHNNTSSWNFEDDFNQQILSSHAYKELYTDYFKLRNQRLKQKTQILNETKQLEQVLSKKKEEQTRLLTIRDSLHVQIEGLRQELVECQQKNRNLQWEVYNQRGTRYAYLYGYSFLEPNQLTYEELLEIQEQIGSVSKGLTEQQIECLEKKIYICHKGSQRQICCICYDEIVDKQWVNILKCNHTHHCDCLKDWLVKQKVCPICKQEVSVQMKKAEEQKEDEMLRNKGIKISRQDYLEQEYNQMSDSERGVSNPETE